MRNPSYFDHASTTPVEHSVLMSMLPHLREEGMFGNASSQSHIYGVVAREAVEIARRKVARLLNASVREIVWTSGATESNNLAIIGSVTAASVRKAGRRVITFATEHKAVLDPVKGLRKHEIEPVILSVGRSGLVDLARLEKELRQGALLVSCMWVNNETGVIQPIQDIANLCKRHGVLLHVDATQAAGKLVIDTKAVPLTYLSLSAHKIYGPKGCGVLFMRERSKLLPLVTGGGQEKGLRPGTLPVHQIVGMGEACRLANNPDPKATAQMFEHHASLVSLSEKLDGCQLNGHADQKVPHIVNLTFDGIRGADLLPALANDFALSNGAACTSAKIEASHVLLAMGVKRSLALASVRISMGRLTNEKNVAALRRKLVKTILSLRP